MTPPWPNSRSPLPHPVTVGLITALMAIFSLCVLTRLATAQEDPDETRPDLKAGPEDVEEDGESETSESGDNAESEPDSGKAANDSESGAEKRRPPKPRARKTRAKINKKTAKAVTALIEKHVQHANEGDLEAYVNDFIPNHPRRKVIESFASRVLERNQPEIEILQTRVVRAGKRRGRARVIQETRYQKSVGDTIKEVVDLAEVTYHCRLMDKGWRIESTSRKRLTRAEVDQRIAEDEESD